MPQYFRARPGLPQQLRVRGVAPPGQRNAPVQVRTRFAGLDTNMPNDNGDPGNPVWPYDETSVWGTDGPGGATPPSFAPPAIGAPAPALTPDQLGVISTPIGQSARGWSNPTTYSGFPITVAVNVVQGILTANSKRNSLIIQNLSSATSPDVAPTLYVGFNNQPALNNGSLALPPGLGFYWGASDCPPRDNIFVVFIGGSGASQILAGTVIQGTYVPG